MELDENRYARILVDAGYCVHRELGPGLLESVYESCLCWELWHRGVNFERQVPIRVQYKDQCIDEGFRADLIVANLVIVELKSVETIMPVHRKQLLSYLRLSGKRLGLLMNFGEPYYRNAVTRLVNRLPESRSC